MRVKGAEKFLPVSKCMEKNQKSWKRSLYVKKLTKMLDKDMQKMYIM
jgi:hypothetical protein